MKPIDEYAKHISQLSGRELTASERRVLAQIRAGQAMAQHAVDFMGFFSTVPTMEQLDRYVSRVEQTAKPHDTSSQIANIVAGGNRARGDIKGSTPSAFRERNPADLCGRR